MTAPRRRVVVTGMGVVSPAGNDVATFWAHLLSGKSAVGFLDFPHDKLRSDVCGRVHGFDPSRYFTPREADLHGRVTQFCVAAATEALSQAGLAQPPTSAPVGIDEARTRSRRGCLMSTGMGAVEVFQEQILKSHERGPRAVSPFFIPAVMPNAAAAAIAIRFGLMGPSYSLASACATGTHSIATSALMIEAGEADVMLAGGSEAATIANTVAGFGNARALAKSVEGDPTKASRPFDDKRAGFVMSEGAATLVLEEEAHAKARGATILARVAGFGMTSDAEHVTRPHPGGVALALAIERALARAGIGPGDIDYINPHATATQHGDAAEVAALQLAFGSALTGIPVSATKSIVGHVLGGAGAVEAVAVVCSLRDQRIHPSLNADNVDPAWGLKVIREAQPLAMTYAMKISAGFGGHNCVLVFEKAP